jgi:pimeloyl-ACP methyl ester carboxylesterase
MMHLGGTQSRRAIMDRAFETKGATITVSDIGSGEPTFVFLHYWGGSARTWHHVTQALSSTNRCLALNLRGWGRSVAHDGRYDLDAMAEDAASVIAAERLGRLVLVGHSMGGKIAQMLAGSALEGLGGLVLVAPAPPSPMPVPAEIRAAMLASYQSAEGVAQALTVLSRRVLADKDRAMVEADTLRGAEAAKRAWTENGMTADVGGRGSFNGPVTVVVGDQDQVERPENLRAALAETYPQAEFRILPGIGHLSPLEAPEAIVAACRELLPR